MKTYETALAYHRAGLSIIPVKTDGSKAPACAWKRYQTERAPESMLHTWFVENGYGIGIAHGTASGNTEVIDYDDAAKFDEAAIVAEALGYGELFQSLPLVRTPRPGFQQYYRCDGPIEGNQKLAKRLRDIPPGVLVVSKGRKKYAKIGDDEQEVVDTKEGQKIVVGAIETRGQGGQTVAPGSPPACHPTGRAYTVVNSDLCTIPTITAEQRKALLDLCRSLTEYADPISCQAQQGSASGTFERTVEAEGVRAGDDFNQRGNVRALLSEQGWTFVFRHGEIEHWRRPGKNKGASATLRPYDGLLIFYVFTTSTSFQSEKGYTPFGIYAHLKHNGDFKAAAKALATEGYGEQQSFRQRKLSDETPAAPPPIADPEPSTNPDQWRRDGEAIHQWKSDMDDSFRRRAVEWYTTECGLPYGEKESFTKQLFGEGLFQQIQKGASVFRAWGCQWQEGVPYWLMAELQGQTAEVREVVCHEFRERAKQGKGKGLTREQVREKLNIVPTKRKLKGWQAVAQLLSKHLGQEIADTVDRFDSATVEKAIESALYHLALQAESEAEDWRALMKTAPVAQDADDAEHSAEDVSIEDKTLFIEANTADDLLPLLETQTESSAGGRFESSCIPPLTPDPNLLRAQLAAFQHLRTLAQSTALPGHAVIPAPDCPEPVEKAAESGQVPAREPWQMSRGEYGTVRPAPGDPAGAIVEGPVVKNDFGVPVGGKIFKTGTQNYEYNRADAQSAIDSAHYKRVEQALSEGKSVPAEVLADYPDLLAKAKPPGGTLEAVGVGSAGAGGRP